MNACRRSRACYLAGCRNESCKAAAYQYSARLQLDHIRGQYRLIDATQTRVWATRLIANGWCRRQIAAAAGIHQDTVTRLFDGTPEVNRATAAAILAIHLSPPATGMVNATGARRRLQALSAIGWTLRSISDTSGIHIGTLHTHASGQRATINAGLARQIAEAYRRLALQPGPSDRVRRRAAARGWHGPAAWDDIDNPACEPSGGAGEQGDDELSREELAAYRRIEIEHLSSCAVPVHEIADRVGLAVGSVEGILRQLRNGQTNSRDTKGVSA
ncbi:hypothetical protein ACWIFI_06150 [Streptomyces albidoflavus]